MCISLSLSIYIYIYIHVIHIYIYICICVYTYNYIIMYIATSPVSFTSAWCTTPKAPVPSTCGVC